MKSFKEYFKDELKFLKEDSQSFAKLYPQVTRFLTEESFDPDVERLLESFAFLSAKINKKIDDAFPELTLSLINLIWPQYLKPIPSYAISRFSLRERSLSESIVLPKGSTIYSTKINDTHCPFLTPFELRIEPIELDDISWDDQVRNQVNITFSKLNNHSVNLHNFEVPLYLNNNGENAALNYKWLFYYLESVTIYVDGKAYSYPKSDLISDGFEKDEKLIEEQEYSFDGFRLLQEYFCFRERFNFIRFTNLNKIIKNNEFEEFRIALRFNKDLKEKRHFQHDSLLDRCVPVMNLFPMDAIPVLKDERKGRYPIVIQAHQEETLDIYDIQSVYGSAARTKKEKRYFPYGQFAFDQNSATGAYYKHSIETNFSEHRHNHFIDVHDESLDSIQDSETLSIVLRCTNRELPSHLAIGDIYQPSEDIPSFLTVRNITKPTNYLLPVMDADIHWLLINYFSLNYLSISNTAQFRKLFLLHDRRSMYDNMQKDRVNKLLNNIQEICSDPYVSFVQGMVFRGISTTLTMNEAFEDEGELYMFCTILSEMFKKYTSINHFHRLTVENKATGDRISWKETDGEQFIF